ncbi:RING-H2 finger protein ATL39 [Mercurialis annua]|uniref:RING-H2 finger protein ATL39 n=1 Tax=Mercurialis annua TaxID=3986 RepID=UPI002160E81B|nr:RING-H2 finger protein ATL39 [Mercurialis annua]
MPLNLLQSPPPYFDYPPPPPPPPPRDVTGQPPNRNQYRLPVLPPERRVDQPRPPRIIVVGGQVFRYNGRENTAAKDECVICLKDFKEGDECRVLIRCNHIFHKACIDRWTVSDAHCPICRDCVQPRSMNPIPVT